MRPQRLELEGFTSFKEPTEIDLADADYFVLVGPTGSGKSTVIDAMCFSLYGSVPRYENRNLVAPVISQGRVEAKVRFDFRVDGTDYTAVRVVRRAGSGASTREARLERDGEVIAGNADEVSDAVAAILGLSFEHFTRCVVLPQGEFARFLHDKPAQRQEMLVRLLNIDVYNRMREVANSRAKTGRGRLDVIEERLRVDFADATKEALQEAKADLKKLEELRKKVTDAAPKLREHDEAIAATTKEAEERRRWIDRLGALDPPEDLEDLADRLAHAQKALAEAADAVTAAEKATLQAVERKEALPPRAPLADAATAHRRRERLLNDIGAETKELVKQQKALDAASDKRSAAAETLEAAVAAEQRVRDEHAAHHLAGSLKKGEPCPVCDQPVKTLPKRKTVTAVEKATKAVSAARTKVEELTQEERAIRDQTTSLKAGIGKLETEAAELSAEISEHPDAKEVDRLLAEIDTVHEAVEKAQKAERAARKQADQADGVVKSLLQEEQKARRVFDQQRDALAPLSPPAPDREDLAADWNGLLSWAQNHIDVLAKEAEKAVAAVEKASEARAALVDRLLAACEECEVEADEDGLLEAAVEAATEARSEVERISKAIEESSALQAERKDLTKEVDLAASLANHLKANGFERWLVNEALHLLVVGASEILRDLSEGQYSLTVDEKGAFLVTDHHNADEKRSARTLSGGETFLASLALALSLSDRLLELAAEGSARLDAIFLDEGFGTLDAQALDTVAGTVENLSAKGRMVGIVTHVRELADRVPLQYRVSKDSRTSRIEKVAI